jgi:hypothetical protein
MESFNAEIAEARRIGGLGLLKLWGSEWERL